MAEVSAKVSLDFAELQSNLEKFTGGIQELIDMLHTGQEDLSEAMDSNRDLYSGVSAAMRDMSREHKTASERMVKDVEDVSSKYQKLRRDMLEAGKTGTMMGGIQGSIGEMMPAQLGGMQSGLKSLKTSILKELPVGGLVGLMMLGGTREEEVRAMGPRIGRMFQQTGQVGRREMSEIGVQTRRLGVLLGKGPTGMQAEIASAAMMFSQAGIDSKEALETSFMTPMIKAREVAKRTGATVAEVMDNMKGQFGDTGESVLMTSVRLDSLFRLGAGTSARMMSQMVRDFNMDATESASVMAGIALRARDAGTSVMAFTTSVMRSAAALRTQRVDITEVAEAQLKFQEALQRGGLGEEFAAGYAERAVGQITQGLSGMGVGLSAVLGERITTRREVEGVKDARKVEGLEAYYAIREGFQGQEGGEGRGMFAETVVELGKLAAEGNRTEAEQRFFLEKVAKTGFEGSKAIVALHADIKGGMDINKAIAKHQDDLQGAFKSRAEETSTFQRSLLKIQDGVAKVGAGILSAVISGFKLMATSFQWLGAKFAGDEAEVGFREEQLSVLSKRADAGFKLLFEGIQDTMGGISEAVSAGVGQEKGPKGAADVSWQQRQMQLLMGASGISEEEARRRYEAKQGRVEFGRTGAFIEKEAIKETRAEAQQLMLDRSMEHMRETLQTQTTATDAQIRMIMDAYETGEKRTRFGTGGEEAVAGYIEHQEKIGAGIRRKSGEEFIGLEHIGKISEEVARKTTMDIGGKQLELEVVVKPVAMRDKITQAKIEGRK